MPDLDVSFMVSDPMLADCFDVVRRRELVNSKGRAVPLEEEVYVNVIGVVTQSDGDLSRKPDGQSVPRSIFVASEFRMQGAIVGYQPDLIRWNGSEYLVKECMPYSRFGRGTYEVRAESMTQPDTAQ